MYVRNKSLPTTSTRNTNGNPQHLSVKFKPVAEHSLLPTPTNSSVDSSDPTSSVLNSNNNPEDENYDSFHDDNGCGGGGVSTTTANAGFSSSDENVNASTIAAAVAARKYSNCSSSGGVSNSGKFFGSANRFAQVLLKNTFDWCLCLQLDQILVLFSFFKFLITFRYNNNKKSHEFYLISCCFLQEG